MSAGKEFQTDGAAKVMFLSVFLCLFISKINAKATQHYSVERWHMNQGRNDWILVIIPIMLR